MAAVIAVALIVVFVATVTAYLWPRPEVRFEKVLVATFGALVGSLIGRVWANPGWLLHLAFIAGGAFIVSSVDWAMRAHRSSSRDSSRGETRHES